MSPQQIEDRLARGLFASSVGNGAINTSVSGITVKEYGNGLHHRTVLTLSSVPITITDANAYGSVLLYTLPEGVIGVNGCVAAALTFTTTSTLASTLNASSAVQFAVGSAAASNATLATTMLSFAPGTGQTVPTFTSSATINVAATAVNSHLIAHVILDGHTTAIPVYLNVAVGTGTDIDGDATLIVSGTITITWINAGDY